MKWEQKIVHPVKILKKIQPGMSIFLSTGVSEPQTLVKHLMDSDLPNLADLELIQLVSFSDFISLKTLDSQKFRFKTFCSGDVVSQAITAGLVDLIPTRFAGIHKLIASERIPVDVAFIQVTPPDDSGKCSLGISIDVAKSAMGKARFCVGEINPKIPRTFGDTFVNASQFDYLVYSDHDPIYFERWKTSPSFDKIAERIAHFIEDRSCIAFSIGPLFESLGMKLKGKRHLGFHSPIFTDAFMDLAKTGAITNLYKNLFPGKSIASYAFGTPELMEWLDKNHMVEFKGVETVFDPTNIGENSNCVTVIPGHKVDLHGRVSLHRGKGNIVNGPMELVDFFMGAKISKGGHTIIGIPGRNQQGLPNIVLSIENDHERLGFEESIDLVVTEHGVAMLDGLTVRERAQALIEIAHPDDRKGLIDQAKKEKILYSDQIFFTKTPHLYPDEIFEQALFKNNLVVQFRPIRPSDEEQMRRLFYRFSDKAVYSRYFSIVQTMPHSKMQKYVNIEWDNTISIVGLTGGVENRRIIAEGRYLIDSTGLSAEVAFIVDEKYNGLGIATFLLNLLKKIAQKRGIRQFAADVLFSNIGMMKVFKKSMPEMTSVLEEGVYNVVMPIQ